MVHLIGYDVVSFYEASKSLHDVSFRRILLLEWYSGMFIGRFPVMINQYLADQLLLYSLCRTSLF